MQISEPMTMFTDYLIFAQSLYFLFKIKSQLGENEEVSQKVWGLALLAIGLASFFGGSNHGFALMLPENISQLLWKLTTYTIGIVSFLIFYGTMKASVAKKWHKPLFAISFLQMIVYFIWMLNHDSFIYVIINYVPAMLMVFVFQLISKIKYNTGSENFMMLGVVISFIGAGVQQSGFDLHHHFNHNDIYHVIQMLGNYMFYRGVLLLKDRKHVAAT
jgi:hypothetical protein